MSPKFHLTSVEMPVMQSTNIGLVSVISYPAQHTGETNPTSILVEVGGKVIEL